MKIHELYDFRQNLMNIFPSFAPRGLMIGLLSVAVLGCTRGETRELNQIFADARSSYQSVSSTAVPAEVSTPLKKVSEDLDRLAGLGGGGDAREVSKSVADNLQEISAHAAFTVRPALAELINQYRVLSASTDGPKTLGSPALQLLVARTYTLLHGELTTTKFSL